MRIHTVSIENFRGISKAHVTLPDHALVIGANNSCKSTLCEALDLLLGPDRSRGFDVITEHDFHRGLYAVPESEAEQPEIRIEAVLRELSDRDRILFRNHIEPWNFDEDRLWTPEELLQAPPSDDAYVLRVAFRGFYDQEEDDFDCETYFRTPEPAPGGDHDKLGRSHKRAIGFLYLRALRTARRAATLQRGSLLDILLRLHEARPRVWEALIRKLAEVGVSLDDDEEFRRVLDDIEARVRTLVPLSEERRGGLHVSRLTREHLRNVVWYFLASKDSGYAAPYDYLGSGTANVLVLALLSAIAEAKNNVIFAMEEPEIALGPHTQRRVVSRLKELADQALLTSHSPFVAERFLPDSIVVLRRDESGEVSSRQVSASPNLKEKLLRNEFRSRFAEGLLGQAVLVVEGVTELHALPASSNVLAAAPSTRYEAFDLGGVTTVSAEGSGSVAAVARFFAAVGLRVFAFTDTLETEDERADVESATESYWEHGYAGFERLVVDELSLDVLRQLMAQACTWHDFPSHLELPQDDDENKWRDAMFEVLRVRKGEGYASRVLALCAPDQLPASIVRALAELDVALRQSPYSAEDPLAVIVRAVSPASVDASESDSAPGE